MASVRSLFARWGSSLRATLPALASGYFVRRFLGFIGLLLVVGILMNYLVMPVLTRHNNVVTVPNVKNMAVDEAEAALQEQDLLVIQRVPPFNPDLPGDVVVDQSPRAESEVKPGRTVYLFVNRTPTERIAVPDVLTLAEGRARAEILEAGLRIGQVLVDTTPSEYEGTITRQDPRPGAQVIAGSSVTLWTSPGLGERMVEVPDLIGLTPEEARQAIRAVNLFVDESQSLAGSIIRQNPEAGEAVREGTEVRIYDN